MLDIRRTNPKSYNDLHIMKSQILNLPDPSQTNLWQDSLTQLKGMIHFKHVFLIGDAK